MPIGNILKRASNYILGSEECEKQDVVYEDNEVLFCKNNVCVHPPAFVRQESDILHYPGYLTVTTKTFTDQYNNAKRPTLMLTWIPNSTLRKCPSTVENYTTTNGLNGGGGRHLDELKSLNKAQSFDKDRIIKNNSFISSINSTNPFLENLTAIDNNSRTILLNNDTTTTSNLQITLDNCETMSNGSNSDKMSICNSISNNSGKDDNRSVNGLDDDVFSSSIDPSSSPVLNGEEEEEEENDEIRQLKNELQPLLCDDPKEISNVVTPLISQKSVTSVNITIANPCIQNECIAPPDTVQVVRNEKIRSMSVGSMDETNSTNWMTPELLAYKHNLSFPESANASPIITRKTTVKCRRFSVDLSQMRSLRLFFNDDNCTSGQLVIASRESQYKILHFHHGGLDHLAQVLHQWHCLLHNIKLAPGKK